MIDWLAELLAFLGMCAVVALWFVPLVARHRERLWDEEVKRKLARAARERRERDQDHEP